MNEVELKRRATLCYERHPRNRKYARDSRSERHLCATFQACLETKGSDNVLPHYHAVLEKLDERGSNFLRPKPREPQPIREPWKDAWGNALPNPFKTDDVKGQRILKVHDPELADQYEKSAKDEYRFEQARREEARECAERNELEAQYGEAAHALNPWANPSASEAKRVAFAKTHPKRVAIYQREAKPPRSNVFGRDAHETTRGKVLTTDPELWHIVKLAEKYNAELVAQEHEQARRQAEAARRKIAELEPIAAARQTPTLDITSRPEERVRNPQPFPR